jgi:hypothetical protein
MQISSISNVATSTAGLAATSSQSSPATSSHSTTAPQTTAAESTTSSEPTQQTASVTSGKSSVHLRPGSTAASIQSNASGSAADTLAGYYSATLHGKSYAGSVEESDGTYTASIMTVPITSATGSSMESADANLTVAIDAVA